MSDQNPNNFVDWVDLNLADPDLAAWDGRTSMLDPGYYDFEVKNAVMGTSGAGNTKLELTLRVISPGPMEGREIRRSYAIIDKVGSRRRIKNLILALQAPTDAQMRFSPASLIGLRMRAEARTQEYDAVDNVSGAITKRQSTDIFGEEPYVEETVQPVMQRPQQVAQRPQQVVQGQPVGQPVVQQQAHPTANMPVAQQAPAQGRPVAQRRPGNAQPR